MVRANRRRNSGTGSEGIVEIYRGSPGGVDELGALDPYVYLNYAAKWQDPIMSYGTESVDRLAMVQESYDPHRIFTDRVPGGFKLPRHQSERV